MMTHDSGLLVLGHPVHHIHMPIKTLKYSVTRLKYYYGILLKTQCSHFQRKLHCSLLYALQSIDDWSFDVFAVDATSEGNSLKFVGYELLQKYDLISKFKVRATSDQDVRKN